LVSQNHQHGAWFSLIEVAISIGQVPAPQHVMAPMRMTMTTMSSMIGLTIAVYQ
jgi:hypothetical protein